MSISPRSAAPGPAATANWLLLGFCLAAWWLASPYLGLAHDAQYYAAEAMRRSGDFDALNRDLFFARGTQGEFSIFPLPYAALTRAIGIQAAALSSTTLVRILWLIALAGLCAVALPRRRALAGLCALLVLPSSYGVMHILAYGEPFATPRHWSELAMLVALGLSLRGRHLAAGGCAVLAAAIHPLMGLPGLLIIVVALPPRWRIGLLLAGAAAGLALVGLGIGPWDRAFKIYDPAWFAIVEQYNPMVLSSSWEGDFLGKTAAWLLLWLEAVLRLPRGLPLRRLAGAAWGVTVFLLLLWALGSALHSVLLIQLQFYRVLWLAQILTPLCLIAALPAWPWRPAERGALALSAAVLLCDYGPAVLLAGMAIALRGWRNFGPRPAAGRDGNDSEPPGRGLQALVGVCYAVLALVALGRLSRIGFTASLSELFHASNNPLLTAMSSEPALVGLCGAVLWLGIARPARLLRGAWLLPPVGARAARLGRALACAMPVAALAFWLCQAVPRATQGAAWQAALRAALPPGDTVYWDQGLRPTWTLLGRACYASPQQAAGALFVREPAVELLRRLDRLDALHFDTGRDGSAAHRAAARPASEQEIAALCADPALDLVLIRGEHALASRHFRWPGEPPIAIYECRLLRPM